MSDRLTTSLQRLKSRLSTAFGGAFHNANQWGAPAEMTTALAEVRTAFDSPEANVDSRSSVIALTRFKETGLFPSFIDLKYGCFGVGLPIRVGRDEWSVIDEEPLLRRLLKLVDDERKQPRRFRKCYQGLMHSYFSYPIFDEIAASTVENWKILQRFLGNRREMALSANNTPNWLSTLDRHANLVTSHPCDAYSDDLLKGNKKKLVAASEGIGIGPESWVWQEAIVTTFQAVADIPNDLEFRGKLNSVLDLLDSKSEVTLSESIIVRCLSMALIRYTKCSERPEHPRLRDMAVHHIGNPWLKRAAWDAYVKKDEARKMVDGWLKRRLISDFFALLSEDGSADQRRLNYWLQFEPAIEDMWFVLGSNARYANASDFREMRKRMEGRLHYLNGQGSPFNNAFVMKIGSFLVVEFGVTGNATYIFHASDSPVDFTKRELSMYSLKGDKHIGRLIHRGAWEWDFDSWLCPRIGWHPTRGKQAVSIKQAPAKHLVQPVVSKPPVKNVISSQKTSDVFQALALAFELKLTHEDNRYKGGAFWIRASDEDLSLNKRLLDLGFKYKPRQGWWKE